MSAGLLALSSARPSLARSFTCSFTCPGCAGIDWPPPEGLTRKGGALMYQKQQRADANIVRVHSSSRRDRTRVVSGSSTDSIG